MFGRETLAFEVFLFGGGKKTKDFTMRYMSGDESLLFGLAVEMLRLVLSCLVLRLWCLRFSPGSGLEAVEQVS